MPTSNIFRTLVIVLVIHSTSNEKETNKHHRVCIYFYCTTSKIRSYRVMIFLRKYRFYMYFVTLSYVCNAFKLSDYHISLHVSAFKLSKFYLYVNTF